jgi:hypothetical protein
LVQDEGSAAFKISMYLASEGLAIMPWSDPPHRLTNHTDSGAAAGVDNWGSFKRKMSRLAKATRGPWGQGRFGAALRLSGPDLSNAVLTLMETLLFVELRGVTNHKRFSPPVVSYMSRAVRLSVF